MQHVENKLIYMYIYHIINLNNAFHKWGESNEKN